MYFWLLLFWMYSCMLILLLMLVVSWNVKGPGCPQKRNHIRDFFKMYCVDIILIQESKTTFPLDKFFRLIGGSFITCWSHLNSLGILGGQFIGCSELVGKFLLFIKLSNRWTDQHFVITSVYGPCVEGCRASLWQELRGTKGWADRPWLIGNVNVTRFFGERTDPEIHIPGMRGFNDLIWSLSHIDPLLAGRYFTWTIYWLPRRQNWIDSFFLWIGRINFLDLQPEHYLVFFQTTY